MVFKTLKHILILIFEFNDFIVIVVVVVVVVIVIVFIAVIVAVVVVVIVIVITPNWVVHELTNNDATPSSQKPLDISLQEKETILLK